MLAPDTIPAYVAVPSALVLWTVWAIIEWRARR